MPKYLELEVSLAELAPRIWRRFLLRSTASFQDLHVAIQKAGGWGDYHLFAFLDYRKRREVIAAVDPHTYMLDPSRVEGPPAHQVALLSRFKRKGSKCIYLYDFGDGWRHLVELRQSVQLAEEFHRRLLGGARAFPSEDCGGVHGYYYSITALEPLDPGLSPEEKSYLTQHRHWLGHWHPEAFDLDAAKPRFDR